MTNSILNNRLARGLGVVFLWAGLLFVFDAVVFSQGVVSGLLGVWTLFVSLPRSLTFTKDQEFRKYLFWRAIIYLGAVVLVFGYIIANNMIAAQRAEEVIDAVKTYKAKYNRYPEALGDIAPEFVDAIPVAKYTVSHGKFQYVSSKDAHILMYVKIPPFSRRSYHFERNVWENVD